MGSLFGGLLADSGHDVTLIDVREEHVRALDESGLRLSDGDGERTIDVTATTDHRSVPPPELLVLFVKSVHTDDAMRDAAPLLADDVDVLTVQNGLGNPETISEYVPERNVIAGVTTHGATLEGPGRVFHAGSGPTTIGRYFEDDPSGLDELAETFTAAGLPTAVSDSIGDAIWEKVLVNVGINAPTALARVENGALASSDPGRRLVASAVTEAATVARREGYDVRDDVVDYVLGVAAETGANASSMLQDVRAGRRTEVGTIHAAVADRARDHGVDAPVNSTLADLVRLTEYGYGDGRE